MRFLNNKTGIFLLILLIMSMGLKADATQLPKPISEYILKTWPKANIRFDGLVELPNGTQYMPVIPVNYEEVQNPAEIIKTIPANTKFIAEPDLVLFANNFSLLRIIKDDGELTLISSDEIPLTVKFGLLPQDLIVPGKLVVPADLRVILGNLKIRVKDEFEPKSKNSEHKVGLIIPKSNISPELEDLINKKFYTTDFKSNYLSIIDPQSGRSIKDIKLSSFPSDVALTTDGRYVLVPCIATGKLTVIDTLNNVHIKDLKLGSIPSSIVVSKSAIHAYITNRQSSSISVIDYANMEALQEIKVPGSPTNIVLSGNEQDLIYNDADTGNIYKIDLSSSNNIIKIAQLYNTSKLAQADNYLFVLSRIDSSLNVFNYSDGKLVKTIKVGNKPVDMKVLEDRNKLYILSAGDSALNIIDISSLEVTKSISLKPGSFPKNITVLNSGDKALITNIGSYELTYIDLNQEKVITYLPINTQASSLVITQQQK